MISPPLKWIYDGRKKSKKMLFKRAR